MKKMEFGQFSIFLIVLIFVTFSAASNECRKEMTCGSCIQRNGTCGWCVSPDYTGASRCETKERLIKYGCPDDEVLQSINSAHLQKNRKVSKKRLLQPQKVTLQLVPNTGYILSVKAHLLAKNNDQRLGGQVVLSVKAPKGFKVSVKTDCNNNHPSPVETLACHGVHNGVTATFSFTILTETCFSKKKTIYVRTNNLRKPQLVITVKAKCECDCEMKKSMQSNNTSHCSGKGKLVCGQCECNRGIFGRNCECNGGSESDEKQCTRPGETSVCSGKGKCVCGMCQCSADESGNDRYSGRYCSCDRMGCPKFNGSFCGGPKRGECHCGQCGCRENYQGRACERELRSKNCLASNGKVCGGNGICEQNQCRCQQPFYGTTCEEFDDEPILAKYCKESESSDVCSGQGTCVRGSCKCYQAGYQKNQTYTGRYCECDDYHCEEYNGKVCGGYARGTCHCGKCRCRENYTGPGCSVSMTTDLCRSPDGKLCSDKGDCVNNHCRCIHGYRGKTCEQSLTQRRDFNCIESGKSEVCSNRGDCIHGWCVCNKSPHGDGNYYSGRFCECDDHACEKYQDEICGGVGRGVCTCGKCSCHYGFYGPDCSLTGDSDNCLSSDGRICSDKGKCVNNKCKCIDGYQGQRCEEEVHTTDKYTPYCIARNSTDICSGQGTCERGHCHCFNTPHELNKTFVGRFCECDDYSCDRDNGKLCGGEERGRCNCGKCICRKDYAGPTCSGSNLFDKCLSSGTGKICGDHGKCINNKCECDEMYSGPTCDEYDRSFYIRTVSCRKGPKAPVCSNRGECIDGLCACQRRVPHTEQRFSGAFCECDDYNCDYYNGQLCGGLERGTCQCNKCRCREGFLGSDCSGSNSVEGCRASNGRLCNGQGSCENNKCRCDGEYRGPTCEECPTCPGICATMKPCVLCRVFGTGSYTFEKCIKCDPIILVDSIEKMPSSKDAQFCLFLDDFDSCRVRFTVERGSGSDLKVTALTKKDCPTI